MTLALVLSRECVALPQDQSNHVGCSACGRRFVWKPELAGKVVKCTCGKVFTISQTPDNAPVSLEPDDFDHAPTEIAEGPPKHCPSCNLLMKATAVVCLNCGYDIRAKSKVNTRVGDAGATRLAAANGPRLPDELERLEDHRPEATHEVRRSGVTEALINREDDAQASRFLDFTLPIIFLVTGVLLTVVSSLQNDYTLVEGLVRAGLSILIRVPIMLAALVFAAKMMSISYGPLSIGLLKLAGIAMGPMALADVVLFWIIGATFGFGFWFAVLVYLFITGIPVSYMFDLEVNETCVTIIVIVLCEMFFKFFLLALLLGLFL